MGLAQDHSGHRLGWPPPIDEDIDRAAIHGIVEKDSNALSSLPMERLLLGTSEIRNRVTVAAAMEGREVTLIGDYIPAYRTLAGTGGLAGDA